MHHTETPGCQSIGAEVTAARDPSDRPAGLRPGLLVILALWAGFPLCGGCHLLTGNDETIIQVSTKHDTAKAARLTGAGIRSLHKGHLDLAAKRFRDAIAADPNHGPAHNNLGLMHYEQGNLYQAVVAFDEAQRALPGDPTILYNLALALESAGRVEEALDLYYRAHEMDRTHPKFLGNLVRLRVRLGETDDLLIQQLQELVLIETRPEWRRWADMQLGLTQNYALDTGPETPDFEAAANQQPERPAASVQDKIIDLTPVAQVAQRDESQADPPPRRSADPIFNEPDTTLPPLTPPEPIRSPDGSGRPRVETIPLPDAGDRQRLESDSAAGGRHPDSVLTDAFVEDLSAQSRRDR